MKTQIVKRGMSKRYNLFIANVNEGENEHSPAAVSHPVGIDEITLRGTGKSDGAISIHGKDNIRHLRDAFIEICRMENIE